MDNWIPLYFWGRENIYDFTHSLSLVRCFNQIIQRRMGSKLKCKKKTNQISFNVQRHLFCYRIYRILCKTFKLHSITFMNTKNCSLWRCSQNLHYCHDSNFVDLQFWLPQLGRQHFCHHWRMLWWPWQSLEAPAMANLAYSKWRS